MRRFRKQHLPYNPVSVALLAALLVLAPDASWAQALDQTASDQAPSERQANNPAARETQLEQIVVTGSLIPASQIETYTPVVVITAEEIQARGFANVHEVLQQTSFATGRVQNNATSASFTQGAETLSLFGLAPDYVKYLVNGVPLVSYPALYDGSQIINNISGIPITLVQRIEILPGGHSSLYGSDAIAGVVNIILKKDMRGGELGARYGWYAEGGGASKRISAAHGFSGAGGDFKLLVGIQWQQREPIWAYQRALTRQFNENGYSPPLASRDYLVYGRVGSYQFPDPADCANVSGQFDGTEGLRTRPGFGAYCGSFFTPGYRTLLNGKDSTQMYLHGTYDFDHVQLYGQLLYNTEQTRYHIGARYIWWGTGVKWGYFYDPELDELVGLQRVFSAEEMGPGGYENTMEYNDSDSHALTVGARGTFGASSWDYDIALSRGQYELQERTLARLADPINDYFQATVLGEQLGRHNGYPVFSPDYAAFYRPLDPVDFYSFTGQVVSNSRTYNDVLRGQITNAYLFELAGGDAGLAVAAEAGQRGWRYSPGPRLLNGKVWGTTAVSGQGTRHRYALTSELRLPLRDRLTVSASARYDSYKVAGHTIDKPTYQLGLEVRPWPNLLLRGKYGTSFKAPSLPDQFQGSSGFYTFAPDYLTCFNAFGIEPANIASCPNGYASFQIFGIHAGNPKLEPVNADTWNAGLVFAPTSRLSMSLDYYHWDIRNQVTAQSLDALLRDELDCRTGELDPASASCQAAFEQITRAANGRIESIRVLNINAAGETLAAVTASAHYMVDAGAVGAFILDGSYTNIQQHEFIPLPGDEPIDLLNDPYYSTDPKTSANASITWMHDRWSTTLYANYIGHTPNNIARLDPDRYEAEGAGKLDPYTTYNLSLGFQATQDLSVALRVGNLLNQMPDMDVASYPGSSGAPYNAANFDVLGRRYYVEVHWKFGAE